VHIYILKLPGQQSFDCCSNQQNCSQVPLYESFKLRASCRQTSLPLLDPKTAKVSSPRMINSYSLGIPLRRCPRSKALGSVSMRPSNKVSAGGKRFLHWYISHTSAWLIRRLHPTNRCRQSGFLVGVSGGITHYIIVLTASRGYNTAHAIKVFPKFFPTPQMARVRFLVSHN
jgi:hypothetical protein